MEMEYITRDRLDERHGMEYNKREQITGETWNKTQEEGTDKRRDM